MMSLIKKKIPSQKCIDTIAIASYWPFKGSLTVSTFRKKINKAKNVMNTSILLNVDLPTLYRPSIYNDYREKKCMLEKKRIPDLLQKRVEFTHIPQME